MTNAKRTRRGFTANAQCGLCIGQANHLWRSCKYIFEIWSIFLSRDELSIKNKLSLWGWLMRNLDCKTPCFFFYDWHVAFATIYSLVVLDLA